MAKRARASRSSHRPGGQGPSRNRKSGTASASDTGPTEPGTGSPDIDQAVDTVEAGYTELAIEEAAPATTRTRRGRRSARARADSLASRAAAEDAFVREDLRRIGFVSLILLAGLVVAWVLFFAVDLLGLY